LSSEFGEDDDASDVNPFIRRKDPLLKRLENTQGHRGWADGEEEGGDTLLEYFFSGESGEESDVDGENRTDESGGDADCETPLTWIKNNGILLTRRHHLF
jgi:hypothetical protein